MRLIESIIRQPARVSFGRSTSTSGSTAAVSLDSTRDAASVTISAEDGSFAVIPGASSTTAGAMTAADKTALDGQPFESRATVEAADIPTARRFLRTAGYLTPGDGGGALYRRADTEPAHPAKLRSADGAWWEIAEPVVESKMLGAVCDGTTDDTAALNDLRDYLGAKPGAHVRFSKGTSLYDGGFTITGAGTISGHGRDVSTVKMSVGASRVLLRASGGATITDVTLRDFAIEGDWGGLDHADAVHQDDSGSILVELWDIDHLTVEDIRLEYGRSMAFAARNCDVVSVRGCAVRYCARDGINCARSHRVLVNDNTIDHVDDDAIAVHMENSEPEPAHKEAVISGNRISDSQGIKIIGLQRAAVTGNQIERCRFAGIMMVVPSAFPVGDNAAFAITITGNTVTDIFNRSGIDGLTSGAGYIRVEGLPAQAGGLAAPPGRNDTATGTIVPLYEHLSNVGSSRPIPDSFGFVVANNVCMRTLPTATNYSEYGYGAMFLRDGWADPAMTSAELQGSARGIYLLHVRDVVVSGNIVSGMDSGIYIGSSGRYRNILVKGNIVRMFSTGGIVSTNTAYQQIIAEGNVLDGDPLHEHAQRGANGTWSNSPGGAAFRVFHDGLIARGNHIRNVPRVNDTIGTDRVWEDNLLYCEPAAVGYDAANRGIGNCPRSGDDFVYVIEDSDPASATYGELLNACRRIGTAMPTGGTYVAGHRVNNKLPAVSGAGGSQYVTAGWIRLTTGSGHASGTDWAEMRTLTGT